MAAREQRPDQALPSPSGCRWCEIERHEHVRRWSAAAGWHSWTEPTMEQRKERILARRRPAKPSVDLDAICSQG